MSATATVEHPPEVKTGEAKKAPPFTADEIAQFQSIDTHAGGAVVCLMAIIFSIGLIMYLVIAYLASQGPS
jgi:hypothetical protein